MQAGRHRTPPGWRRAQDEAFVCGLAIWNADHAVHGGVSVPGNFGGIIPLSSRSQAEYLIAVSICGSGGRTPWLELLRNLRSSDTSASLLRLPQAPASVSYTHLRAHETVL